MKCEIREICGDWALDIMAGEKVTIYFNSRQNALNVKKILEVDDSIPNAATVCDMKEVIRCKECIYFQDRVPISVGINIGSCCTRIDYAIVHGYRNCEASVDKTRLWVSPNDYCSRGERKESQ